MKKTILAIFIICFAHSALWSQLQWLNPQPSGYINTKISFVNTSTGYLMNSNGDFFVTKDTGNSWQQTGNYPQAQTFQISDSTGIIPSYDSTFYLSINNGTTWERKIDLPGNVLNWVDIVGRDTIFLLRGGADAVITFFKSVDRGKSWQIVRSNSNQFFTNTIDFINSKTGYALRADGMYKTSDGGVTWNNIYGISTFGHLRALKFFDTENGFAYGESRNIIKTTNGGQTWTAASIQSSEILRDIFCIDLSNAFAVGDEGIIYKTTDAGISWNYMYAFPGARDGYSLNSQYFFNASTGIVTGFKGRLLKTTDGGSSWKMYSPTYVDVTGISFGDSQTGYATTWNNVYKTINAGKSWSHLALATDENNILLPRFEHARFINKDTGFVTVDNPVRLHMTSNGGQTWAQVTPAATDYQNISSVSFISKDTGFISLRNSTPYYDGVFRTDNGGYSWQKIGGDQYFDKLFFVNNKTGYATRYADTYRTSDGGITWTLLTNYEYVGITSIFFTSASKGFIAGSQGYLRMTTDSGNTWSRIPVNENLPDIIAIKFYNDKVGYITDNAGNVFKTNNGGYTWRLSGTTAHPCSSIIFRQDTTVVFAGLSGAILSDRINSYQVDSVNANPSVCGAIFSGVVTSTITSIDSIFFEYGTQAFTKTIAGSPLSVKDSTVKSIAFAGNLSVDSVYKMRMRIVYKGSNNYSADVSFTPYPVGVPPVITASFNVLSSSDTSGNQWYFNGELIPGAVSQIYKPTKPGRYTVKAIKNGCSTGMSDDYIFFRPFSRPPGTAGAIMIYPNPIVNDELIIFIREHANLSAYFYDLYGRNIVQRPLTVGTNHISLPKLERGAYIIKIRGSGIVSPVFNGKIIKL